ncbi:hypothetical protein ILUMI_16005, partial [Ignelater luminosus]
FFRIPHLLDELNANFFEMAPLLFLYDTASDKDYKSRRIKEFYFVNKTIANSSKVESTN